MSLLLLTSSTVDLLKKILYCTVSWWLASNVHVEHRGAAFRVRVTLVFRVKLKPFGSGTENHRRDFHPIVGITTRHERLEVVAADEVWRSLRHLHSLVFPFDDANRRVPISE